MQGFPVKGRDLRSGPLRGVTIIEMVVVIAVAMILLLIGSVTWNNQQERARRGKALIHIKDFVTGLKMYRAEQGDYPAAGPVSPLAPHVTLTGLSQLYDYSQATTAGPNGLAIYRPGGAADAVCIEGVVNGIVGTYRVMLCAQNDEALPQAALANQPACQWDGRYTWRACAQGF